MELGNGEEVVQRLLFQIRKRLPLAADGDELATLHKCLPFFQIIQPLRRPREPPGEPWNLPSWGTER